VTVSKMARHYSFLVNALLLAALSVSEAMVYPVGLTNCGESNWIAAPPKRAVTMNQGTTEVLLALNLSDSMVGTAYLDDKIWPELAEAYAKVPVLAATYPDIKTLMSVDPDFVFASYSSAFAQGESLNYSSVVGACKLEIEDPIEGDEATKVYCRKELHEFGIQTYLQNPYCEKIEHRNEVDMDGLFAEIWDIANIFDVHNEARELIDSIEAHLTGAIDIADYGKTLDPNPVRVLWLDGWSDETPFVGACCGSVNLILKHAGAENVFDDLGLDELRSWDSAPWEDIAAKDPDLIVVVDASWD
jgi:iron complex transport system substrate-binding protein